MGDKTKPENETNFWSEINEKKDAIFSQLKNKFSNQERRGQKVFIPAVHVYSQAIKPQNSQKRKVPQNAYLRKSSETLLFQTFLHLQEKVNQQTTLRKLISQVIGTSEGFKALKKRRRKIRMNDDETNMEHKIISQYISLQGNVPFYNNLIMI